MRAGCRLLRNVPLSCLVLFFPDFLAITFARQCFLDAFFLTWLQVKGVPLNFLDNILGLYFAFETTQGIFERFTFLYSNLCQKKCTSLTGRKGYGTRIL